LRCKAWQIASCGVCCAYRYSTARSADAWSRYIVGRKTGRRFSVPVAYTRHEGDLLIGTPFAWGHNLRTGEQVDILLQGKRRPADVRAFRDEADVVHCYTVMARNNRNFASFNKDPPRHKRRAGRRRPAAGVGGRRDRVPPDASLRVAVLSCATSAMKEAAVPPDHAPERLRAGGILPCLRAVLTQP
jgi:hypothetical protein